MDTLPASHAAILELRFGDDLTVPQIARILRISESAAESRLGRARQGFRAAWLDDSHRGEVEEAAAFAEPT